MEGSAGKEERAKPLVLTLKASKEDSPSSFME